MILSYGTQRDYDGMAGATTDSSVWSAADLAAMGAFMQAFNRELEESGELVETRGLAAPVHTRRVRTLDGDAVTTDHPYADTQEVLAAYWVIECESFERASQIAARLGECPAPPSVVASAYADVRPIAETPPS
ncbi:MAG: YciI family protein [Jatrophihabitantaceae bacterium]